MTKDMLLDTVDALPKGVNWTYQQVNLHGDLMDDAGKNMTKQLELWYRDPVNVVWELMGNPMFKEVMKYAPEKVFHDEGGEEQVVNEMWTASWWWEMQVSHCSFVLYLPDNLHTLVRNIYRQGQQLRH